MQPLRSRCVSSWASFWRITATQQEHTASMPRRQRWHRTMHLPRKRCRDRERKSDTMVCSRSGRNLSGRMTRFLRLILTSSAFAIAVTPAVAQISFTTAVDLALKTSPRVKMAEAEVDKARAALEEARDVYIPNLVGGSGLGYSYGFPVGQPSIFNFTSQSLLFNYSQHDYLRASRAALNAAHLVLMDV